MKKILAYLTPEKQAGFFDLVVGYDAGVDAVVPYTKIKVSEVKEVIYGAVFTRHPKDLKNTALFIGGHDFWKCKKLMDEAKRVFKTLPEKFRVSLTLDPNGACTTASSCVGKITSSLKNLSEKRAVILAGTGPVGQCVATFLAKEGAEVSITSRRLEKANRVTKGLKDYHGIKVRPLQGSNFKEIEKAVEKADIVVSTGPEGIRMLPKKIWSKNPKIKVMADVNAVHPTGIEGLNPLDNGIKRKGKICFGAIGIGNLKIKVHHQLVRKLFKTQEIFDIEKIYQLTSEMLR